MSSKEKIELFVFKSRLNSNVIWKNTKIADKNTYIVNDY